MIKEEKVKEFIEREDELLENLFYERINEDVFCIKRFKLIKEKFEYLIDNSPYAEKRKLVLGHSVSFSSGSDNPQKKALGRMTHSKEIEDKEPNREGVYVPSGSVNPPKKKDDIINDTNPLESNRPKEDDICECGRPESEHIDYFNTGKKDVCPFRKSMKFKKKEDGE